MSRNIAGGLRQGHDGTHAVRVIRDGEPVDLTNYTVTATASFDSGATTHVPTVAKYQATEGVLTVSHTAADLDSSGDLAIELEFTPIGTAPAINPNARPIIVPVRALYQEAS